MSVGHKVVCVVTQPDRKKGRGLLMGSTVIKDIARKDRLEIYQPENINTPEAVKYLKKFESDLFVVVAYGQILSEVILNIPRIFCVNVHASLLPKYRGAAPINWAIINGDKATGVTIMKLTREMDAGDIILQKESNIAKQDTAVTLENKLSDLGSLALLESLKLIKENKYKLIPQDKNKATFAPKLKKQDGLINWNRPAVIIYDLIRGCLEWPGAFTYYKGKMLKIYKASVVGTQIDRLSAPGEILETAKDGIVVATQEHNLLIEELQLEGRRRMKAIDFIAGHKLRIGDMLMNKK